MHRKDYTNHCRRDSTPWVEINFVKDHYQGDPLLSTCSGVHCSGVHNIWHEQYYLGNCGNYIS